MRRALSRIVGAGLLAAAALAASPLGATPSAAPERDVATTTGPWMLSLDGSPRRCRVLLSADANEVGQAMRFPAGCRRALPILNGVGGWTIEKDAIRLVGPDGHVLLDFAGVPDDEGAYRAKGEDGASYAIAVETERNGFDSPFRVASIAPGGSAEAYAIPRPRGAYAAALTPGIFTLDRFIEKDVCRVRLAPGREEVRTAQVLDGCRDGGLAMFDPVGWRFADGRLTLVARKGHTVDLIATGDGRWRRDPEVGTTFVLRRVEN